MPHTLRWKVRIKPGGVIEIHSPEFREGDEAEVFVVVNGAPSEGFTPDELGPAAKRKSLDRFREIAGKLEEGEKPFDVDEMRDWIRKERDSR